jgi:hypothetical protein
MKRRGFLGALAAACAASRLAPSAVSLAPDARPMPNTGACLTIFYTRWGAYAPGDLVESYEHRGVSITVRDDEFGYTVQHLGEYGVLVARTYPPGMTPPLGEPLHYEGKPVTIEVNGDKVMCSVSRSLPSYTRVRS